MSSDRGTESAGAGGPSAQPTDAFLIAGVGGGDAAALRKLMDRYDRLVRYAIYRASRSRCRQDPQFLDAVAAATWDGFVRAIRRDPNLAVKSTRAYLVRIARNHVISARRKAGSGPTEVPLATEDAEVDVPSTLEEPESLLSQVESLDALRGCLEELPQGDRTLASQLGLITERRWREAAEALGMAESTLRSRWTRVLARLRTCIERKTGESVAPPGFDRDP